MQKSHAELNTKTSVMTNLQWIEEDASVLAIDGDFAEVLPTGQSSCQSCSKNAGCSSTNAFAFFSFGNTKSYMRVSNTVNAKVGDKVVIGIPSGTLLMSTMIAYGIPLVLLLLGALLGQTFFSYIGWSAEVGSIIFGGLSLLLGFVISSQLAKIASLFKRYQPVILSINKQKVKPISFRGL